MTAQLALLGFVAWLAWALSRDAKERAAVSPGVWIAVVWVVIYASRPVTAWFGVLGDGHLRPESRDEGNPTEAAVTLLLIVAGLIVLGRRGTRLSAVIEDNRWLFVFYAFWMLSAGWSDYPIITLKRVIKDLGNVIMVLLVLTEKDSTGAIKAVCVRMAYVCIPLSIVLIRYFPQFGRGYVGYDRSELMLLGVTTHKNTLGVLALVGALFLLWDLLDRRKEEAAGDTKGGVAPRVLVLAMCWYLLVAANSATSLVCAVLGSGLLMAFAFRVIQGLPGRLELYGVGGGLAFLVLDSAVDLKRAFVVDLLGRDMTLTTRTEVWPILLGYQDNPVAGAGFNTFWAGERLVRLQEEVGGIIQAHNGYLETYLNGGLLGVGLLAVLLLSAYTRIRKRLIAGSPDACIRLILLLLAVIYNNSEASFNKVGLMWFLTLFALMEFGAMRQGGEERPQRRYASLGGLAGRPNAYPGGRSGAVRRQRPGSREGAGASGRH